MIGQPKMIRRIYMISSAVFSAASCVYGWAAPLGAALGLAVNLTEDNKESNINEFAMAIDCALDRTYNSITSDTKRKIIEELRQIEVEPDSLNELIKKTEAYQYKYCTEADVKEILSIFDVFFRDEISKRPYLSNLYILSTGFVTIEKLKQINDIIVSDEKKLGNIEEKVSGINKMLIEAKKIYADCMNGIVYILVSLAIFLGLNIFLFPSYHRVEVLVAPICYSISAFLVYYVKNERSVFLSMNLLNRFELEIGEVIYKLIGNFFIPIILTVSCFWMILWVLNIKDNNLFYSTTGLVIGNIISILIKKVLCEE